ncbi:MAG TPA: GNAT family N-acetyltransferase [Stellaceae bacterium]|nr:GNAT family N-acetyltransferase [Stellaceae bacterium]
MAIAQSLRQESRLEADVTVRVPREQDAEALVGLVNTLAAEAPLLFVNPIDPVHGQAEMRGYLAMVASSENQLVLVAEHAGRLVGLATAAGGSHPAKRGVAEIGIGVLSAERGLGIGRILMRAVENWARGAGIHRLQRPVASGNQPAIGLYRKSGFEIEGVLRRSVVVDGRPVDQYLMAKLLA